MGQMMRVRTYVRERKGDFFCVAGMWFNLAEHESGPDGPSREPDHEVVVGPFCTLEVASSELRGKFRELVCQAVDKLVSNGARVVHDYRSTGLD